VSDHSCGVDFFRNKNNILDNRLSPDKSSKVCKKISPRKFTTFGMFKNNKNINFQKSKKRDVFVDDDKIGIWIFC
jgi:hypothetical protein